MVLLHRQTTTRYSGSHPEGIQINLMVSFSSASLKYEYCYIRNALLPFLFRAWLIDDSHSFVLPLVSCPVNVHNFGLLFLYFWKSRELYETFSYRSEFVVLLRRTPVFSESVVNACWVCTHIRCLKTVLVLYRISSGLL